MSAQLIYKLQDPDRWGYQKDVSDTDPDPTDCPIFSEMVIKDETNTVKPTFKFFDGAVWIEQ